MSTITAAKTYNSHILYVEDYEEVFFDVFRIRYNNQQHVLEGVRINGDPYVKLKIKEGIIAAKLEVVKFGKSRLSDARHPISSKIFESIAVNEIPLTVETIETVKVNKPSVIVKEKKVEVKVGGAELFNYIDEQMSKTRDIVRNFVKEAHTLIEDKVSNQGSSLLEQFIKEVNKITPRLENSIKEKIEQSYLNLKTNLDINNKELKQEMLSLLDHNVDNINERVNEFLDTKQSNIEKNIQQTLTTLEKKSVESLNEEVVTKFNSFKNELKNITTELSESLRTRENKFESSLEKKCREVLQTILVKEDIFAERYSEILDTISKRENQIENSINEKYSGFKDLVEKLSNDIKENAAITESKINDKLKNTEVFVEKKNDFASKTEMQKLRLEMHNQNLFMRKLIGSMSGGGSVAQQFAAGGVMNGTLNVMGNYLSGGQNILQIFDQRYVPMAEGLQMTQQQVETVLTNMQINTYTETITGATAVWNVNHNLNRYNITITTYSNDIEIIGSEQIIDANNVRITFMAPVTGMVIVG